MSLDQAMGRGSGILLPLVMGVCLLQAAWAVDFQHTIVFIKANTMPGENLFLRGGVSLAVRPECAPYGEVAAGNPCSIPIQHRTVPTDTASSYYQWSQGDAYLDWYGAEPQQGQYDATPAGGTPIMWTTSIPSTQTVGADGAGYTPYNRLGEGYWMLDVNMDCDATEGGWFEFKAFVTPFDLWEGDRSQYSECGGLPDDPKPFNSINHVAKCGLMNLFYFGEDECNAYQIPADPTTPPPAGCGQRQMFDIPPASLAADRIVNGDVAVEGRWPWQGVLQYGTSIGGCAGVLIDAQWAITAAHCVDGTNPAILKIRFAEQNLYVDQGNEQIMQVDSITAHPKYGNPDPGDPYNDNDVAMLHLAQPVDLASYVVQPACLPYGYATDAFVGLSTCWATGFGDTKGTGESYRLQEINVPVYSEADCSAYYGNEVTVRQVCMGTTTLSPCGGDSGGPLVCYTDNNWVLVGTTSWGDSSCQNSLGVYSRITEFLTWIDSVRG